MLLHMRHFERIRLAEDKEGIFLPDEPDRPGLRGQVRAGGGEPDEVFLLKMLFGFLAEFGREVDHRNSSLFVLEKMRNIHLYELKLLYDKKGEYVNSFCFGKVIQLEKL